MTPLVGDPGAPYWLVIYTKNGSAKAEISLAISAETADQGHQLWLVTAPAGCSGLNIAGPFDSRDQAYGYRSAWQKTR